IIIGRSFILVSPAFYRLVDESHTSNRILG
ncbi:unnamed protein product, partial [marine sediment metagenome]